MSSDIDQLSEGPVDEPTPADSAPGFQRRGLGGRLYHGETAVDFYGRRKWGFLVSGVLLVITIVSLFVSGLNLGLDFKGGVAWDVPSETLTTDQANQVLEQNNIDTADAKIQVRTGTAGRSVLIQVGDQSFEVQEAVRQDLAEVADVPVENISTTQVSSTWGRNITEKAVRALVISLLLMAVFISWRLEWRMAIAAIAAMVHDVLLSVGVYSVTGFQVTPATVIAFLTILGYSLYDTIVVFDKVRENTERYSGSRVPYADIINVSMNQTLMRSLNTTLSSVLPVVSLLVVGSWILGATTLREFAIALLVGMLTGAYSSIFIAAPILTFLKEREPKFRSEVGHHATGIELERLVLGGSPQSRREGRKRSADAAAAGVDAAAVATAPLTPAEVLNHPPRPRKKKRHG
jgi:preprotein translocase subunit SecF